MLSRTQAAAGRLFQGRSARRCQLLITGTPAAAAAARRSVSSLSAGGGGAESALPTTSSAKGAALRAVESSPAANATTAAAAALTLADASERAREITARCSGVARKPREEKISLAGIYTAAASQSEDNGAEAEQELKDAMEAADALRALTSSPGFVRALSVARRKQHDAAARRDRDDEAKEGGGGGEVGALHRAFLSVTSWLQSSIIAAARGVRLSSPTSTSRGIRQISNDDSIDRAVIKCIDLAARSTDLALPLHLPLFRTMINTIAAHSSPIAHPTVQIMEVSNLSKLALHPTTPPSVELFQDALIILVKRGLVREASELLGLMRDEHGIMEVDATTGLAMIGLLVDGLGLDVAATQQGQGQRDNAHGSAYPIVRLGGGKRLNESIGGDKGLGTGVAEFDPADAMELVLSLRGPLLRQLDDAVSGQIADLDSMQHLPIDGAIDCDDDQELSSGTNVTADMDDDEANLTGAGTTNANLVDLIDRLATEAEEDEEDDGEDGDIDEEECQLDDLSLNEDSRKRLDEGLDSLSKVRDLIRSVAPLPPDGATKPRDDGNDDESYGVEAAAAAAATATLTNAKIELAEFRSSEAAEQSEEGVADAAEELESSSELQRAIYDWDVASDPDNIDDQQQQHHVLGLPTALHDSMCREVVYVRKGPLWNLPDVVDQLVDLNRGSSSGAGGTGTGEVLYTREYEEHILNEIAKEEEEAGYEDDDIIDDE